MKEHRIPSATDLDDLIKECFKAAKKESYGIVKPGGAEGADSDTSAYDELMSMTGLDEVKRAVKRELAYHKVMERRRKAGRSVPKRLMHLLLTGNPGTGKTTCARLVGRIYRQAGLLSSGHLIETSRAGLVGQYIGQSEKVVSEKIEAARGGILFIDEIYSLVENSGPAHESRDFGHRVLDTLMPVMSDPRADIMVIGAGYTAEMKRFINANPGLASRFPLVLNFKDFTLDELMQIGRERLAKYDYYLTPEAEAKLTDLLAAASRLENSGNARLVTTVIENYIIPNCCERLDRLAGEEPTDEALSTIVAADIPSPAEIAPLQVPTRQRLGY